MWTPPKDNGSNQYTAELLDGKTKKPVGKDPLSAGVELIFAIVYKGKDSGYSDLTYQAVVVDEGSFDGDKANEAIVAVVQKDIQKEPDKAFLHLTATFKLPAAASGSTVRFGLIDQNPKGKDVAGFQSDGTYAVK